MTASTSSTTRCKRILLHFLILISSDANLPPDEIKAKIESIARVSPMSEGPSSLPPVSPTIPPHNPQAKSKVTPQSTEENSLISFDDDSMEFVDALE
jgi:hypothetical protein